MIVEMNAKMKNDSLNPLISGKDIIRTGKRHLGPLARQSNHCLSLLYSYTANIGHGLLFQTSCCPVALIAAAERVLGSQSHQLDGLDCCKWIRKMRTMLHVPHSKSKAYSTVIPPVCSLHSFSLSLSLSVSLDRSTATSSSRGIAAFRFGFGLFEELSRKGALHTHHCARSSRPWPAKKPIAKA